MRIAVTGATGFLGRHVLKELRAYPVNVVATSHNKIEREHNSSNINWVQLDIARPPSDIFESMGRPDVLIHLVWEGLPNYRSLHHIESELPRQYNFLQKVITQGLKSLVVTGTCFEYGMQSGPLSEDTPAKPETPYGFAKHVLRRQLEFLQETIPFMLTWARLFYMFGDGQAENSLWPQFKRAVERGDSVFKMSGGEQLRDFLPVTDVARCLVQLALVRKNTGVVNVCSGRPISVRCLVEDWIREENCSIKLNLGYYPYPDYEPMAFWGRTERLKIVLEKL